MSNNYKVSVIIPVYNGESYLKQCLDSLTVQSLKEIEIICIDDGSTDNTLEILEAYKEKDSRITILTQKNKGAGAARNLGIQNSKGEYLSILDADDFYESEFLERAYQKATCAKADVLVVGSDQYYEDTREYIEKPWVIRYEELPPYRPMNYKLFTENVFKVFVGWSWDKLFRRDFVLEHELTFQEIRTSNDLKFVFMAIVLAERIEVESNIFIHQRRNNKESLSNTRERSWQCFYEALLALREELKKNELYSELEQDYINYALHFALWNLNTLTGKKQKELFHILKKEWFWELGILSKTESYFYNKKEYIQCKKIMKQTWRRYAKENKRV